MASAPTAYAPGCPEPQWSGPSGRAPVAASRTAPGTQVLDGDGRLRTLLVTQRLDGIHRGRPPGGVKPEDHADQDRDPKGQDRGRWGHDRL